LKHGVLPSEPGRLDDLYRMMKHFLKSYPWGLLGCALAVDLFLSALYGRLLYRDACAYLFRVSMSSSGECMAVLYLDTGEGFRYCSDTGPQCKPWAPALLYLILGIMVMVSLIFLSNLIFIYRDKEFFTCQHLFCLLVGISLSSLASWGQSLVGKRAERPC
jgi:hypothetical protein